MKIVIAAIAICLSALLSPCAAAKAPMTAFGEQPSQRAATLSPDGDRIAFISRVDDQDFLMLFDFRTKTSKPLARISDIRARQLYFAGNNYIILVASKTTHTWGFSGRYETSAAFSYNIAAGKFVQLLGNTDGIFPAQSGLGRILAIEPDGKHVYMPAFMGSAYEDPSYDLLRVELDSGRGLKLGGKHGSTNTIDWFVAPSGEVVAREDFDEKKKVHTIFAYDGSQIRKIYSEETPLPSISVSGLSEKTSELMVVDDNDTDFDSLFAMSTADGKMGEPLAQREDVDIDDLIVDQNRVVRGVQYAGMAPSYQMLDKALDDDLKWAQSGMPYSSVYVSSWSADWSKVLLYVSGGAMPERYVLMDRPNRKLSAILNLRREIRPEDVGEQLTIEYKARDGLTIPSLLTWPAGLPADQRKNLPLVVLPHGGPHSYDQVGFDWLAQFLANEGYVVLQPNFRGSAGFGASFANAGKREWGRKMQDDVSDGVKALAGMGWVDPGKVCIVGWSYGGYAALAGGAFTPDLYKCVASIAGVSDLIEMLNYERDRHGRDSSDYTYWSMVIGDPSEDREAIHAVSPARHADAFKSPVLLIHGTDDTTVPSSQSDRMNDALHRLKKPVTYLKIKGDDHGLLENDSRRQALTALSDFLAKYLK